jgi:hypothetical protein
MDTQLEMIKQAAEGLLYQSEGDYPLEVITTADRQAYVQEQLKVGVKGERKMEVTSLEHFFRNQVKAPYGALREQEQTAQRFRQLLQVLKEELTDIAVYRMGAVEVDVFILGRLKDDSYGGLKTKVIET